MKATLPMGLMLGLLVGVANFSRAETIVIPTSQPATQPAGQISAGMNAAIHLLQNAKDPSTAVDAYAVGVAIDPENRDLKRAYVKKMVDLDAPDMATSQGQQLAAKDSNDLLAVAVVAYEQARQGRPTEAILNIIRPARQMPDVPFIQRTTAQLLAWYDSQPAKPTLSDQAKSALEDIRKAMASKRAFADAYKEASDAYQNQGISAVPSSYLDQSNASPPSTYTYTRASQSTYVPSRTVYIDDYAPVPYYYAPPVYYSSIPTIVFLGRGHDRHSHHFFKHRCDSPIDHHWRNRSSVDHGQTGSGMTFRSSRWEWTKPSERILPRASGPSVSSPQTARIRPAPATPARSQPMPRWNSPRGPAPGAPGSSGGRAR